MSRNRGTASYCFWVCFVLLLILAIVRTSQSQVVGKNGELINCMKYPFAPRCRGISAKRSPFYNMGQRPPNSIPDESMEDYDTKRNKLNRKRSQFMRAIPMSYEDFIAGMKRSF